jgi:hypothetical protein
VSCHPWDSGCYADSRRFPHQSPGNSCSPSPCCCCCCCCCCSTTSSCNMEQIGFKRLNNFRKGGWINILHNLKSMLLNPHGKIGLKIE